MARFLFFIQALILCLTSIPYVLSTPNDPAVGKRASNACGRIVNSGDLVFEAKLVYECLTSVPFNGAVATRFINYYNDTLKFQSTLSYLKNPPAGYQQPAVDVLLELGKIQAAIDKGVFKNQYEFEATLESLIYALHDGHVDLVAGIMGVFSFGTQYSITSVSKDGIQLPKVYLSDELLETQVPGSRWNASAIALFNGVPAWDYLREFASLNAFGTLETHSDINQLMTSPALEIQGIFNTWGGGAAFYPGETLKMTFENGTNVTTPWLAVYNSPGSTGPLETGGDFYNFFVLGFYPASYDPYASSGKKNNKRAATSSSLSTSTYPQSSTSTRMSSATSKAAVSATSSAKASSVVASSASAKPSSWDHPAYPATPDIAQRDLSTYGGGFVSGYFIGNGTAVLSIPSFLEVGDAVNTFSDTVSLFLRTAKAKKMTKIIIDVQQNSGGDALLAFDTFKQFFPNLNPYGGSRMRAHTATNVMGDAITGYWESLTSDDDDYYDLVADEWLSSFRINANTKKNFTSWSEFYGPHPHNGDNFTTTQQYDLANFVFDMESTQDFDEYFAVYGYSGNPANTTQPYPAANITILSDGICSSTCALFMEMMHHEAGVRTIAAGGYPLNGPMQAPAGTRGARGYPVTDLLDSNIGYAQAILSDAGDPRQNFFPNRTAALDVYVTYMGINLRDQIRNGSDIPLQFVYEAANCRIWYTKETFYNYTALWQYAANAMWTNPKLCINGSTGYASTGGTAASTPPTPLTNTGSSKALSATDPTSSIGAIVQSMYSASSSSSFNAVPITDDKYSRDAVTFESSECKDLSTGTHYEDSCPSDYYCLPSYSVSCDLDGKPIVYYGCAVTCWTYPGYCANGGVCQPFKTDTDLQLDVNLGYCVPPKPTCKKGKGKSKIKPGKGAPPSGYEKKRGVKM